MEEVLVLIVLAEKKEEDFRGRDFVIGAISGVIIGYIINGLIPGLACVFLVSRACSIVAVLFFNLSITSCYISENSDSTEETDLVEIRERERRRLAKGGNIESFDEPNPA